jgi:flavorubredoxin
MTSTSPFAPAPPANHHPPLRLAPDTWLIRSMLGEGEGPLAVYVNSVVIAGREPVIVDTGTVVNRSQWLADVSSIVDLEDVRWVFLSHDDHDHVGNLVEVLDAAPNATLVTTWFSTERMAGDVRIPPHRMRWVGDGETFDAGDRTLVAIRPPLYDAPTTRGLFDPTTGVYWAVDTYGIPVPAPADDVADLDPAFWEELFAGFNGLNSPWHAVADPVLFGAQVDRIERLAPTVLATAHGPAITGANVAEAHRKMRRIPGSAPMPVPGQVDLDAMLAAVAPHPVPA